MEGFFTDLAMIILKFRDWFDALHLTFFGHVLTFSDVFILNISFSVLCTMVCGSFDDDDD